MGCERTSHVVMCQFCAPLGQSPRFATAHILIGYALLLEQQVMRFTNLTLVRFYSHCTMQMFPDAWTSNLAVPSHAAGASASRAIAISLGLWVTTSGVVSSNDMKILCRCLGRATFRCWKACVVSPIIFWSVAGCSITRCWWALATERCGGRGDNLECDRSGSCVKVGGCAFNTCAGCTLPVFVSRLARGWDR